MLFMKRLVIIFLLLALLVILPFLIWGAQFEESMSMEKTVEALRSAGAWAWVVAMGLLLVDVFLPILGTVVMSALGLVYGWFWGGILAGIGSIGAGVLAYGIARKLGRGATKWLTGEGGLAEGEGLFSSELGGWLVALSRWMPVLPEDLWMVLVDFLAYLAMVSGVVLGAAPLRSLRALQSSVQVAVMTSMTEAGTAEEAPAAEEPPSTSMAAGAADPPPSPCASMARAWSL